MEFDTDIAIVGGGLNGPCMALALAQAGLRVTVIDALARKTRNDAGFDGRSYALALTSQRLLAGTGSLAGGGGRRPAYAGNQGHRWARRRWAVAVFHAFRSRRDRRRPNGLYGRRPACDGPCWTRWPTNQDYQMHGQTVVAQTLRRRGVSRDLGMTASVRAGADWVRWTAAARPRGQASNAPAGIRANGAGLRVSSMKNPITASRISSLCPRAAGDFAADRQPRSIVWSDNRHCRRDQRLAGRTILHVLRPRFGDFLGDIKLAARAIPIR